MGVNSVTDKVIGVLLDEGFNVMLFVYAVISTLTGHPFVGLGIGVAAFALFLVVYVLERRRQ